MILRLYWERHGDEVHATVIVAHQPSDEGKYAGELRMTVEEWFDLQQLNLQPEFYNVKR